MDAMLLIERALAAPKTHRVVTTYADGDVKNFDTRNLGSAENYAFRERRKIGRDLIARDPETLMPDRIVRVVSVAVELIP
jgi:hypothetical protein